MLLDNREVFFKRTGSKRKLATEILPLLNTPHSTFCDVFGGAGNILLRKEPVKLEVFNDLDKDVFYIYTAVQNYFHEFSRRIKYFVADRDYFEFLVNENPTLLIDKAVRAFYLIIYSFGGIGKHFATSRTHTVAINNLMKTLLKIYKRIKNVTIENKDWTYILSYYDNENTLFYLDPPYPSKKEIYKNNSIDWDMLYSYLTSLKGKFALSAPNDTYIKSLFKDFKCVGIDVKYTSSKYYNNIEKKELLFINY